MTLQQYKKEISKDPRYKKLNFKPDGKSHEVYRITHIIKRKHYYGSKSNLKILGESYISTSYDKNFIKEQKEHPERFKYKIIKTYNNSGDKIIHEAYLHQKFDVKNHVSFYNKANQTPYGFDTTGRKMPQLQKDSMGDFQRGKIISDETKKKMSVSAKESFKNGSRDFSGKNNPAFGIVCSDEKRKAISEKLKNNPKITCPHCSKVGAVSGMKRYHFDNCRILKS